MRKLFLTLISLALAGSAYAQLNTFSEGDVISAEKMNENFEYLEQQFRGSRATTVDCGTSGTGSGINEAIAQGFNDITVSGTCNENLLYTVWRDDKQDGEYQPSNKLAPRYLRISGTSADSKIVDASSKSENTISVNSGSTLFLENITVSGGRRGIVAVRNSNLLLSGVRIENFSQRGIRVDDSSYLGVDAGGVTIIGAEGAEYGVYLATGSSGWIQKAEISNVQRGISLFGGSFLYLNDFVIDATSAGIWQTDHTTIVQFSGKGIIKGTLEEALSIHRANFYSWDAGTLEIKDVRGGYGIDLYMSNASISNLELLNFDNTGSGGNPAIGVHTNSNLSLENAEISGSTDGALVSISDGSITAIRDSTLTVSSAENAIAASGSSRFNFQNSTISGSSAGSLVSISDGSSAKIQDSTIETNSADNVLIVSGTSRLELNESQVTGNVTNNIINIINGSSADIHDSTIDMTNGDWGTAILISAASTLTTGGTEITSNKIGLYVERNSFADFGSGSSIKAGRLYRAGAVVGSSGMRIRPGSGMSSEGAAAMEIKNSSYVIAMDGANIDRTDVGVDVEIGQMSSLTIWEGTDVVWEVSCWGRSLVFANESAITNELPDDCKDQ